MTEQTHTAEDSWERLSALLEGDLSEAEAEAVERELGRDPALQAVYDDLQRTTRLLRTAGPVAAPADFLDKVLAAVEHEPIPANQSLRWRLPFPIEGLLVAAAVVGVLFIAIPRENEDAEDAAGAARVDLQQVVDAVPTPAPPPPGKAQESATPTGLAGPRRGAGGEKAAVVEPAPSPAVPSAVVPPIEPGGTSEGTVTLASPERPAPVGFAAPLRYSVNTADAEAVTRLVQLARRSGGKLSDKEGNVLSTTDLDAGPAVVYLEIPADRLSEFDAAIRALGRDVSRDHDSEKLQVGETVEVQVTVRLAP